MITIKESMLIRKCINDYVLENKLDFDKSPLFMDLMTKLKEYEKPKYNVHYDGSIDEHNLTIQRNNIDSQRKSLNKELKKYNFQTITNKKILELMESERIESINKQKELIK